MLRRVTRVLLPVFLVLLALSSACSSSSPGAASTRCSQNSDCSNGLTCIPLATFADGGCDQKSKACSKTCTTDGDCASLGAGYKCFSGCSGSPMFCGATQ